MRAQSFSDMEARGIMLLGSFLLTGMASQRLGFVGLGGGGDGGAPKDLRLRRYEQFFSNKSSEGILALSSTIARGAKFTRCRGIMVEGVFVERLGRTNEEKRSWFLSRGGGGCACLLPSFFDNLVAPALASSPHQGLIKNR